MTSKKISTHCKENLLYVLAELSFEEHEKLIEQDDMEYSYRWERVTEGENSR